MSAERLEKIVDDFIDTLAGGEPPDAPADVEGLSASEREDLKACVDAARWIESAIVETSRRQMEKSGVLSLAVDDPGETLASTSLGDEEDLATGKVLGDFEILREIGRGGMGIVFAARQKSLDRQVALKVLPPGVGWNKTVLERFLREARAAAHLEHNHIIPVYQINQEQGVHYFAMQLIEGFPLSRLARASLVHGSGGTLPAPESSDTGERWPANIPLPSHPAYYRFAARIMSQAAGAIDYAHQRGVLHRDVKPSNLIMDHAGEIWIADFGLARLSTDASVTMSGQLIGTLNYMSPEQASGEGSTGPHSDIYGLGATLYELLTLRTPFTAKSTQDLLLAIQEQDPTPPTKVNTKVPGDLEIIALKAMDKDAGHRYASAGEMAADLQRWLDDQPIRARRASLWRNTYKWIRRKRIIVSAAALITIVVASSVWLNRSATKETAKTEQKLEVSLQQRQAEGDVTSGQRLFEQQDFEAAQEKFTSAAQVFSKFVTGTDRFADALTAPLEIGAQSIPYVYLGLIALRDQNAVAHADAVRQFDQALQLDPGNVLLKSLKILSETRDYDRVQSVIREVENFSGDRDWGPFAADAYLALAKAVECYDLEAATRLTSMALEGRSGFMDALGYRGWLHLEAGRYDLAVRDLEVATYVDAKPEYSVWMAMSLAELGESEQVGRRFDQAIRAAPESFMVRAHHLEWLARDYGITQEGANSDHKMPRHALPDAISQALAAMEALTPGGFQDHYYLGLAYDALNLGEPAQAEFRRAISAVPEGARGYLAGACFVRAAWDHIEQGRNIEALSYYARALEALPHPDFLRQGGDIHAQLGQWDGALAEYGEAEQRGARDNGLFLAQARAHLAIGHFRESLGRLDEVLRRDPQNLDARELRVQVFESRGDYGEAANALTELLATRPGSVHYLQWRARARLHMGDEAAARADLIAATDLGLRIRDVETQLGGMWSEMGMQDKALSAYARALEEDPDRRTPRLARIGIFVQAGREDKAIGECDQALATLGDDPEVLVARAGLCEHKGREDVAIDDWRRVLVALPHDEMARWHLARLLFYAKDLSLRDPAGVQALVEGKYAPAADPSQTDWRIIGHMRFHQGRYSDSFEAMMKLEAFLPADWLVLAGLRFQGFDVPGAEQHGEQPIQIEISLPKWVQDLNQYFDVLPESESGKALPATEGEPER